MALPQHLIRAGALRGVALAVAATTLLAGWASGTEHVSGSEDRASSAEMEHIHGLGVDPADGTLYAGTHYGLFKIPASSEPALVGDHVQDFMGFTVVVPHHFVASGYPGEGQGGPAAVGLLESTDAGKTWKPLSLSGEADFHYFDSADGAIYGLQVDTGSNLQMLSGSESVDSEPEFGSGDRI